jgi:hypothetical protein
LFCPILLAAQFTLQPKQIDSDNKGIIYNKEWSAEFKLHTNGYGIGFNWGEIETYYKTKFYSITLDIMKHPREYRQNLRPTFYNAQTRPFVYGKQNSFMSLKGSIGNKVYLSEKAQRKGLAVGFTYQGGLAIGILKPYYLEIINPDPVEFNRDPVIEIKYTEETAEEFLEINRIEGSAGFFKGFDELQFIPGLQAKVTAHFAWGAFDEYVKAFDIGLMAEVYPRDVPIMVVAKNSPYFLNLYLNLQLGKRQ